MSDLVGADTVGVGSVITIEDHGREKYIVNGVYRGGMGVVYQLVPVRRGLGPLALKTFQDKADPQKFARECEIWVALSSHANIAKARWFGDWRGQPVILADWYEGSMDDFEVHDWPDDRLVEFATGLIEALRYANDSAHVIHQDIKPGNVLLDEKYAPKLSDFGIASLAPRSKWNVRAFGDRLPSMKGTVTVGGFGGTLPFMAPELLFQPGTRPSTKTDVYSLGVTLYVILTREHPYAGPDTHGKFSPHFRMEPLRRVLRHRGSKIKPLLETVIGACQIDPSARPSEYRWLLHKLGAKAASVPSNPALEVERIVAQAVLYRNQDRDEEAAAVLKAGLKRFPGDPVLLNSFGLLWKKQGNMQAALACFDEAYQNLRRDGGRWNGKVYCDPLMNAVVGLLSAEKYKEAYAIIKEAWAWEQWDERSSAEHWYTEFGWMMLYERKNKEAVEYILRTYKAKRPDGWTLSWACLAAWLSGQMEQYVRPLRDAFYQCGHISEPIPATAACVVSACLSAEEARHLLALVQPDAIRWLAGIEHEHALGRGGLRPPQSDRSMSVALSILDVTLTGGRNCHE